MNSASTSPSLLQPSNASSSIEEIPEEELTCQFIVDETSQCVSVGRKEKGDMSRQERQQKQHYTNRSMAASALRKQMVDGSVLNDSPLVDQNDSLQEIPMTPEKEKVSSRKGDSHGKTPTDESLPPSSFEVIDEQESEELQIGDHVYQWRSLAGVPWVFQHHGIVMDVVRSDDIIGDDENGKSRTKTIVRLIIADFSNVETQNQKKKGPSKPSHQLHQQQQAASGAAAGQRESSTTLDGDKMEARERNTQKNSAVRRSSSSRLSLAQEGIMRTYTDTDKWHKVHYQSKWWMRQVYRSGTCTKAKPDPVGLVLARVHFILQHPELLPDYHVFHANCECVAFWCKTGRWSTLQASTFLELTAAGQVKSSATLAAAAAGATQTVTVPGKDNSHIVLPTSCCIYPDIVHVPDTVLFGHFSMRTLLVHCNNSDWHLGVVWLHHNHSGELVEFAPHGDSWIGVLCSGVYRCSCYLVCVGLQAMGKNV